MQFRTEVKIEPFEQKIDHTMGGMSVGSCFAQNVAARMKRAKLPVVSNPFGVVFNPISIADTLEALHAGRTFTTEDLVCDGSWVWSSFAFHGSFSATAPRAALQAMNRAVNEGGRALADARYVIITFGTAWVFELADEGGVVANCHRFPAGMFVRRRLAVEEIVERYDRLFETVLRGRQVIFTVSPVRHVKDGFAQNTLSKAALVEAVHELLARYPSAHYFPAFEIMNDELRDYRFYAEDMVHPSSAAIEYIWEKFSRAALTPRALEGTVAFEALAAAMEHRPRAVDTASHREFLAGMSARVEQLSARYPEVDLSVERKYFSG